MKPIRLLFLFFLLGMTSIQSAIAQADRCGTVENQNRLQKKYPAHFPSDGNFEHWMKAKQAEMSANKVMVGEIVIPVVVHVIHNGDAVGTNENISEAQVLSQIQVLNEDFGKMMGSRGHNTNPVGADTQIEWCMAQIDPNGNPTNGINRVNLNTADWTSATFNATAKPATQWDPTQYCNVWVAELSGGTLGYAQFPEGSGLQGMPTGPEVANTDGVVMTANAFGTADADDGTFYLNPTYNLGRTMTHEVGHWLGLRHIWGDGDCTDDDFVTDTPNSDDPNYSCVTHTSCGSVDMIENYMDYTNDACMNIFTAGQKARIDVVMTQSPRRMELTSSNKCTPITEISFYESDRTVTEATVSPSGCSGYQDVDVVLRISNDPSEDAVVDLVLSGTATEGVDYEIISATSFTFPKDQNMSFTVSIRVYDDADFESTESIILGYTITTIGDAEAGAYNQTYMLMINDNEINPLNLPQTVLSEDFESGLGGFTTTSTGTNAFTSGLHAAASSTYYSIGTSNTTNFAYISDDNCNCDLSDARLMSPIFSLAGLTNARLTFDHAFANSAAGETFNVLVSSDGGTTWGASVSSILNPASAHQGNGIYQSLWVNGVVVDLSAYDGMSNLKVAFSYNDNGEWAYGTTLDNFLIEGEGLASIQETMNTGTSQSEHLGPNATVHFFDPVTNNIMMTVENLSAFDYGCTSVSIHRDGTGAMEAWNPNTSDYITSKTFDVNPEFNDSTGNYNVTLYYTAAEINGWTSSTGMTISDLEIIKTGGDITNPDLADIRESAMVTMVPHGNDYAISASFDTGFSDFAMGTGGSGGSIALPLELFSFAGERVTGANVLSWETLSEVKTAHFELERATNGLNFAWIANVEAAGISSTPRHYEYSDRNFSAGNSYYRLKMVDEDGGFTYSDVVVIKSYTKGKLLALVTNPVGDRAELEIQSAGNGVSTIRVFDGLGRVLLQDELLLGIGLNAVGLDVAHLAPGVYFVNAKIDGETGQTVKLIKK